MEKGRSGIQQRVNAFRDKRLAVTFAANKEAGEKFLAANKTKEGVKELPGGVQYKVIKEGNGPIPADSSRVMVSYEGRTIEGKVFDSSDKNNDNNPVQITIKDMIPGWIDALTHMPVGSEWEIYVPQEKAYGAREAGEDIKPFSALIFKLKLVSISPEK